MRWIFKFPLAILALLLLRFLVVPPHIVDRAPSELIALQGIITIHKAEANYFSRFGKFADSIEKLIAARELKPLPAHEYRVTLTATRSGYAIDAVPNRCGKTATRSFLSGETLVVHFRACPLPATEADPIIK